MNRLAPAPQSIGPLVFATTDDSTDATMLAAQPVGTASRPAHAVFVPLHYEPGYSYPLVVWLHGSMGNEQQVRHVMPKVSMRNYIGVAPQATSVERRHKNAFRWRQTSEDIEEAEARILDCIAVAERRFSIHRQRIFLAGFGCGGTMAVRVAWNHPGRFAGVASIGGSLPSEGAPLRRVNELRHLPCLLATTRNSREYPEQRVCQDLRLLHAAGCTVALRQYPGGDDLTTGMLQDFDRWMMELVCGGEKAGC